MTLTRESEALAKDLSSSHAGWSLAEARDTLAAIEAAVRAEQAAEVERLRAVVKRTASMGLCSQTGHEHLMAAARAALAATPVAPAPAEPRP